MRIATALSFATLWIVSGACAWGNPGVGTNTGHPTVQLVLGEGLGSASPDHDLTRDGIINVVDVQTAMEAALALDASTETPLIINTFSPNSTTISTSEGAPYGDCDIWSGGTCANQTNFGYGPTRVIRLYICLGGMVTYWMCSQNPAVTGPLSAALLTGINDGIAAYAGSGVRLLIRFIYNFGPTGPGAMDAPLDLISTHIDQLAPILLQNKDLIFALEAGFIGTWGEWHDSTNGNDTAAAQKLVLDKELAYFGGAFPILVRYPGDVIQYAGGVPSGSGLGIHDDYYASNSDDGATWNPCDTGAGYCLPGYTASQLMSYTASLSASKMFAGEFGAVYPALQTCDALDAYSATFHVQSITLFPYPSDVGAKLETEGCALSFYNRVGTRLVLQRAVIGGDASPGGPLDVAVTVRNDGYGRVNRQRPSALVLIQNGQPVAIPIPIRDFDLSTLDSLTNRTYRFEVTLPNTLLSGQAAVALLVPDPATSLSALPAYALPMNSIDSNGAAIFDSGSGYNYLDGGAPSPGPAFQLDAAGVITSDPGEVVDGRYSIKGAYSGTATFVPFLESLPAVLPLTPNHPYRLTFRYKILTAPTNRFEARFASQIGGPLNDFVTMFGGEAGDTGIITLRATLGPHSDYVVRLDIPGTGAISVDDLQVIDDQSGTVIAASNGEPLSGPKLILRL